MIVKKVNSFGIVTLKLTPVERYPLQKFAIAFAGFELEVGGSGLVEVVRHVRVAREPALALPTSWTF